MRKTAFPYTNAIMLRQGELCIELELYYKHNNINNLTVVRLVHNTLICTREMIIISWARGIVGYLLELY